MKYDFSRMKVLVTGGTRGFGRGFAESYKEYGGEVTITGTEEGGNTLDGVSFYAVDFSDEAATTEFAEWAGSQGFNIVVNNAGVNIPMDVCELDPEQFKKVQLINVHAPMKICTSVAPGMKSDGWGRIVNVSSIFGKIGAPKNSPYCASKFAINGMSIAMALDLAPYGVLVNCVAPGVFWTDMTRAFFQDEELRKESEAKVPMGRFGQIPELVKFVLWLSSEENTYITG